MRVTRTCYPPQVERARVVFVEARLLRLLVQPGRTTTRKRGGRHEKVPGVPGSGGTREGDGERDGEEKNILQRRRHQSRERRIDRNEKGQSGQHDDKGLATVDMVNQSQIAIKQQGDDESMDGHDRWIGRSKK